VTEAKPETARTLSSPSIESIRLGTTFRALYYSTLVTLTTPATAPHARNVNLQYHRKRNHHGSRVYPTPDHKHPSPPLPSRGHPFLSARGWLEYRLTLILSRDEGLAWAVDRVGLGMRNRDQVFGLRCAADGVRAGSRTKPNPCEQTCVLLSHLR
jgi:hypothetical protein